MQLDIFEAPDHQESDDAAPGDAPPESAIQPVSDSDLEQMDALAWEAAAAGHKCIPGMRLRPGGSMNGHIKLTPEYALQQTAEGERWVMVDVDWAWQSGSPITREGNWEPPAGESSPSGMSKSQRDALWKRRLAEIRASNASLG